MTMTDPIAATTSRAVISIGFPSVMFAWPAVVGATVVVPEGAALPTPDTREELQTAHRMSDALAGLLGPAVEAIHPWTVDPPGHPRRLRDRLTWLLLRPGRLDRDG